MTFLTPSLPERQAAVSALLDDVRRLVSAGVSRGSLDLVAQRLEALAAQPELFPSADFPPPDIRSGTHASTRYHLNPGDGDDQPALYLNSLNPGKSTWPHNHTTWAVIVALEGQELNRLYRRTDDASDASHAVLEFEREVIVQPGTFITFLPDDIHSIHVTGERPTLHLHLYGRPLETLDGRIGIDPASGAIVGYNRSQMAPSR